MTVSALIVFRWQCWVEMNDCRLTRTLRFQLSWRQFGSTWRTRTWRMLSLSRAPPTVRSSRTTLARCRHHACQLTSLICLARIVRSAFLTFRMITNTDNKSYRWHHWVLRLDGYYCVSLVIVFLLASPRAWVRQIDVSMSCFHSDCFI